MVNPVVRFARRAKKKIAYEVRRTLKNGTARSLLPKQRSVSSRLRFQLLRQLNAIHLYQPIPWLDFDESKRARATYDRWQTIEDVVEHINEPGTAMDLGSQLGYFSLQLAEEDWLCLAVEGRELTHRAAMLIQQAAGITGVSHRNVYLGPDTIDRLPNVDVTIFFSLWHHLCHEYGFEAGKDMLTTVLERTRMVCFFETGQTNEKRTRYTEWLDSLPAMEPDPRTWLSELLRDCGAVKVASIGQTGTPHLGGQPRELFAAFTDSELAEKTLTGDNE